MMLRSLRADRRGAIAIFFAVTLAGSIIAIGSVLNMAQVASVRAGLQRTLDEAALSGAAAYSANSASFKTLAIGMAGRVFCNGVTTLPMGASVVAAAGTQACATGNGPLVTAVTDSYIPGTLGLSLGQCGGTYLPAAPYVCGFILTVSATVTVNGIFPSFFGSAITVSGSAMAANPFINFAKIFSLPNGVKSTAKYANSIWVYLLLMSSNGGPAFSTSNPGARPDDSACIGGTGSVSAAGGPDQVTCGSYVMLASTMYAGKGANYSVTVRGVTTTYNNGVVVNLTTPVGVTATTPLGIAFPSIAGGNYVQYSAPGVYGYAVTNLGNNPPTYVTAANACIYPYNKHVYSTVGQVWTTAAAANGEPGFKPVMPWGPLITHWFYSSFLSNNLPPSQPEIALQAAGPISVASIPSDPAQTGANIAGSPTYNSTQSSSVPTTCPATTVVNGSSVSNSIGVTMSYPSSGNTNCSVYVTSSTSSAYVAPSSTGSCFSPTSTLGQQYASASCQSYGTNYYTYYWNDMGGAASDDKNYGDGIVQIGCNGTGQHVTLIN